MDSTSAGDACQRLWVSRASSRRRGILAYPYNKEPNELALFDELMSTLLVPPVANRTSDVDL